MANKETVDERITRLQEEARGMGASEELVSRATAGMLGDGDQILDAVKEDRKEGKRDFIPQVAEKPEDKFAEEEKDIEPDITINSGAPERQEPNKNFYIPDANNIDAPIYDLVPRTKNLANHSKTIFELMFLRGAVNPDVPFQDLYDTAVRDVNSSTDINSLLSDSMQPVAADREKQFLEELRKQDTSGMTADQMTQVFGQYGELDALREHFSEYVGFTSQLSDEFADEDMDQFERRQAEAKNYAFSLMSKQLEDRGAWDTFSDVMGQIFVPSAFGLAELIPDTGVFSAPGAFERAVKSFQSTDPVAQMAIAEELVPNLMEAYDGNALKAAHALQVFFSPDFSDRVSTDKIMDLLVVADYAAVGPSLVKGLGKGAKATFGKRNLIGSEALHSEVKASFNQVQTFNSFENPEMAAVVNWQNMNPGMENLPKASLTTPEESLLNVSPVNIAQYPGNPGYVKGISPESVRLVEGNLSNLKNVVKTSGKGQTRREARNLEAQQATLENEVRQLKEINKNGLEGVRPKNPNLYRDALEESQEQLKIVQDLVKSGKKPAAGEVKETRIAQGIIPKSVSDSATRMVADTDFTPSRIQLMRDRKFAEASTPNFTMPEKLGQQQSMRSQRLSDKAANTGEVGAGTATAGRTSNVMDQGQEYVQNPNTPEREAVRSALNDVVKPELIKADEISRLERRMTDNIQAQYQDAGKLIRNIDFDEVKDGSMKARITTENGVDEYDYLITRDDVGSWVADNQTLRASTASTLTKLFSPQARLGGLPTTLVEDATFLGGQAAKVRSALSDVFKQIENGLNGKQRGDLYELLLVSDEQQTLFTVADLKSGAVETRLGKRPFEPEVVDAYYRYASVLDESRSFADYTIRRGLELDNFKEIRYVNKRGGTERTIGQPHKDFSQFNSEASVNDFVYVANTGTFVKAENIKPYRQNYKPVRLLEDEFVDLGVKNKKDGKIPERFQRVSWMLVKDEGAEGSVNVSRLPDRVLNKSPGVYIPRIYNPGYHFVRDMGTRKGSVLRAFKTAKEADDFIKQAAATGDGENLVRFQDKDFNKFQRVIHQADAFGGLYTGGRKKQPLLVEEGGKTSRPERLAANDSIQRYINAISSSMPVSEYRIMQIERFKKTVNQLANKEGKQQGFADPNDFRSELTLANTNEKIMMEEAREFMVNNLNIPTNEETRFADLMQRVAMMSEGKFGRFGEHVKGAALNVAERNPVSSLKGGTFHALLGWFNLRQLYVQAQNAALSISMYPQHALGAGRDATAMRMAWNMSDEARRTVAKRAGIDPDDFVENIKAFKKSGLEASIRRNADLGAAQSKIGGVGMMQFRELSRKGLVFYEEGELFGRLITWNIARRTKGKMGKLSDKETMELFDETMRLHLNMQKENSAWWQNNIITGPMTQFMQVQAKLIENIMPEVMGGTGRWTAREKSQALAGQVLLYGTVGVPLVEEVVNRIATQTGKTPEQIQQENPQLSTMVNRGAIGVMANGLGFDNDFSTAGSILSGLNDSSLTELTKGITEVVMGGYDDTGAFEMLAGPSLTTVHRSGDAIGTTFGAIRDLVANPTMDQLGISAFKSLDRFASITSSWSNGRKIFQIERMGGITSNAGNMLISKDELDGWNLQTQFALIMGFPTNVSQDYWNKSAFLREQKDIERQTREALTQNFRQLQMDGDLEGYQRDKARILAPHNTADQIKLTNQLMERIISGKSASDKQDRQFMEAYINSGGQVAVPFSASN